MIRNRCLHHDDGHVPGVAQGRRGDGDLEPVEHGLELHDGGQVLAAVAGAGQADHEAVADQLISAPALEVRHVGDAGRLRRGSAERQRRDYAHRPSPRRNRSAAPMALVTQTASRVTQGIAPVAQVISLCRTG